MALVEIARLIDPSEAEIAWSALDAAGFQPKLFDRAAPHFFHRQVEGIRIMTPEEHAEGAAALLADAAARSPSSADDRGDPASLAAHLVKMLPWIALIPVTAVRRRNPAYLMIGLYAGATVVMLWVWLAALLISGAGSMGRAIIGLFHG